MFIGILSLDNLIIGHEIKEKKLISAVIYDTTIFPTTVLLRIIK
jgi:hypothetical protein